jgi:hypothetical protein
MLALRKPTSRGRVAKDVPNLAAEAAKRIGTFILARPGTVALTLLFGGLGVAVSANALWMQSAQHPAPLFRQTSLAAQHPAVPRKAAEESAGSAEDQGAAMLPPPRPAGLGKAVEANPQPAPSRPVVPGKHAKDPIADLLGGPAPVPPAPIKPAGKGQPVEKAARPAPSRQNDSIAGLIEQTARSH